MTTFNLDTAKLPRKGSTIAVRTPFEVYVGKLCGVVPGNPRAAKVKDRRPKLAMRTDVMSATVPEVDIREVRTLARKRKAPDDGARVVPYVLFAGNGRRIRVATRVEFEDGTEVAFTEKLPKREAVRLAAKMPTHQRTRRQDR